MAIDGMPPPYSGQRLRIPLFYKHMQRTRFCTPFYKLFCMLIVVEGNGAIICICGFTTMESEMTYKMLPEAKNETG